MASYMQSDVQQLQQQHNCETNTPTKHKYNTCTLPKRFALSRHPNKTTTNNSNNSNIRNKLLLRAQPSPRALRHTLHATVLLLLTLPLSNWLAQASAAATVTATQVRHRTLPNSKPTNPALSVGAGIAYNAPAAAPSVSVSADEFNSSAFSTNLISIADVISLTSTLSNVSGSGALNGSNQNANSINASYAGAGSGSGGGASAALITTSSIWDPMVGAHPTDVSAAATSPSEQGSNEDEFGGEIELPPWQAIIVSIVLLLIIIGTVIGNVLVCIAVCMVRKLRRPCNYLLVSLALSDLCVALLVMPMAMLYEVLDKWNFGPILCDIWVSFDVLCCTASILNLCAISVDRYLAITKPLEYGVKRTPRRMMACVALVWLVAASISLPPLLILGNEHVDEHGTPICIVCQNFAYQIYATLGSFYIPLSVMLFVYYQIFRAARRIVLEEKRAQTHLQHALNGTGSPPGNTDLTVMGSGNGQRHSSYGNTSLTYSTCGGLSAHHTSGSGGAVSGTSGLLGSPHQKKLRFQLAKEKKASTTLGIIMSAFTICWLPFFILALIRPFVESETVHVPPSLASLFLWLGYANSLLNPIIYATLNRDFRKPFQEILYFRCSSLNTMMRENYYQDQYGEPPSQRVMLGDERHGARESFL
ncbi:5-hydroxytryptamine receptor 1 [Bactrocera dorsalis]|uniref:5-hydroxytryptamine receptor 1 n=1 Tax=Bactrocera dorsalis TaxID=27457 RepID=A0A6J0RHY6_BACDO|nr:5-hydroxytryptamine receptor 1 [Bactrocera dorsalis]XP_029405406.2 5-hydroxytryptamine receptor 1 [Bactrocera dorsalis]XP_049304612.1 5-hydroxytryptamine receptor 1 [Bactrocera dorsalis]XP_049304613.1 5-hydroxytryptamine receptor 1 [Bactrocera dorsalis]XP_049304614.1 5-hydroxytryptamine receptor 1 [Bactrocera dorsalis]